MAPLIVSTNASSFAGSLSNARRTTLSRFCGSVSSTSAWASRVTRHERANKRPSRKFRRRGDGSEKTAGLLRNRSLYWSHTYTDELVVAFLPLAGADGGSIRGRSPRPRVSTITSGDSLDALDTSARWIAPCRARDCH